MGGDIIYVTLVGKSKDNPQQTTAYISREGFDTIKTF
jgi:hypothetical protein